MSYPGYPQFLDSYKNAPFALSQVRQPMARVPVSLARHAAILSFVPYHFCSSSRTCGFIGGRFGRGERKPRFGSQFTMAAAGVGFIHGDVFWLDSFALRQWDDEKYQGTRIDFDKVEFTKRIHEAHAQGAKLIDGYAPFCKHVFVENFTDARVGNLEITDSNKHLVECGYSKRRPEELAVLSRYFPKDKVDPPVAAYLDIILYSREQMLKEYSALERSGNTAADLPNVPWAIISVKAQMENFETPMQPITMMRNALGVAEGGSSVPLERAKYEESVAYWENHATIL